LIPFADGTYLELVGFRDLSRAATHRWWNVAANGGGIALVIIGTTDIADTEWRYASLRERGAPQIEIRRADKDGAIDVRFRAGQRGVRVDRRDHILDGRLEADRERRLGDQLTRLRSDDVDADDAQVLSSRDDLREPIDLAQRERAPRGAEVVARDLHVGAVLLLGLRFGQSDLSDLGVRVHDIRRRVIAHHGALAKDGVDGDLALGRRHVCELRGAR